MLLFMVMRRSASRTSTNATALSCANSRTLKPPYRPIRQVSAAISLMSPPPIPPWDSRLQRPQKAEHHGAAQRAAQEGRPLGALPQDIQCRAQHKARQHKGRIQIGDGTGFSHHSGPHRPPRRPPGAGAGRTGGCRPPAASRTSRSGRRPPGRRPSSSQKPRPPAGQGPGIACGKSIPRPPRPPR